MDDPKKLESLIWEARARISWGDSAAQVEQWLREQNVPQQMVDDVIRVCVKERDTDIRKRGMSELLTGLGIMVVLGGGPLSAMFYIGYVHSKVFAFCGVVIIYGFIRTVRGLGWLSVGGKMRGSVASMEDDILP